MVVQVFVAERNAVHALGYERLKAVLHLLLVAPVHETGRRLSGLRRPLRHLLQKRPDPLQISGPGQQGTFERHVVLLAGPACQERTTSMADRAHI